MLFLVFESLSPGSAADAVARLLPRPPSLCAVGGVTLKYLVFDTLLIFCFSSAGSRFCRVCVHHFIHRPSRPAHLEVTNKRQTTPFVLLVSYRVHRNNFSGEPCHFNGLLPRCTAGKCCGMCRFFHGGGKSAG